MEFTAEILCRRTNYGDVCEWKGARKAVAKVYGDVLTHQLGTKRIKVGDVFSLGRLRLRVVRWPLCTAGAAMDDAAVMLESPHAQLYQLYREKAESIVRFVARCESAVLAFKGNLSEGQLLTATAKIADRIL
jgi:hypothetical protein